MKREERYEFKKMCINLYIYYNFLKNILEKYNYFENEISFW